MLVSASASGSGVVDVSSGDVGSQSELADTDYVFSPAKAIFAEIGVLLSAAKDVATTHDTLVNLFSRVEYFFCRLEIYTVPPTTAMTDIIVEIMVKVLTILAIATKEIKRGQFKRYLKRPMGNTKVEDSSQRLDKLTQEEARKASAGLLKITATTDTTCSLCSRDHNHVTVAFEISLCIPSNVYLVNNRPSAWCAPPLIDFTESQRISVQSPPYPPGTASKSPLEFDLEVIGNAPPTADQIRMILGYLPPVRNVDDPHHVAALYPLILRESAPSLTDSSHSFGGLARLALKSPLVSTWPIVMDWMSSRASAGDSEGVMDMSEDLCKKRDG